MDTEIQDVKSSTLHYMFRHYWLASGATIVVLGGSIVWLWIQGMGGQDSGMYFQLFIALFTILAAIYGFAYRKVLGEFMLEFGKSIGFSYSPKGDMTSVSGHIFGVGDSPSLSNVLSGTKDGYALRIYDFQHMEGAGKSRHSVLQTVFEATLTTNVPDIMILGPNVPWINFMLSGPEKITLEGDFNKYFTVYTTKNFEEEVFQILTPDVMVKLIDHAANCSIELNGGKLYIFKLGSTSTKVEMQRLFDLATLLIDILEKQTRGVNVAPIAVPA